MATVLVVSTLLSPFSAVSTASAEDAGHLTPGIYKPTPIGIGTNINVSTSDPGVATYVGRDMYIGGKPSDTNSLDASNAPAGSYAAEAEGLTVVRGKLAMNPIKESWSGHGFRFGTVGFGSQFRPGEGSTVLAVAGIDSAITSMSVGYSGTRRRRLPLARGPRVPGSARRQRVTPLAMNTPRRLQAPLPIGILTNSASLL